MFKYIFALLIIICSSSLIPNLSYSQVKFNLNDKLNLDPSDFNFGNWFTGTKNFAEVTYGFGSLKHISINTQFNNLIIKEFKFPVHMLTKSSFIEEDLEVLKEINKQSRTIVSMSFSSVDEKISNTFEPGVPSPEKRLDTLKRFKDAGIAAGMFLLPVIPFVTDKTELMEAALEKASEYGLDYVVFGGMTLKNGRELVYFF